MRWLAITLVACSAPVAAPPPARPVTLAVRRPAAPVTCSDAGVILRGPVADERDAGPMKEAAIAQACLHDAWTAEILACVGGTVEPKACLARLADPQRAAFEARLARWHDEFPDEDREGEPADDDHLAFVDCARAIGDVSQYAPVLAQRGEERELAIALRRHHVLALCADWTTEARTCFAETRPPERCEAQLEPAQRRALHDKLAEVDAVMSKVAAAKAPTCKQVVDVHYAEARWKDKLAALAPAAKKQIVIEARKRMREACTAEKWTGSLRGCIAVDGSEACFIAGGMTAQTWGFPPSAIPIKTGIPACDAYGDALRALAGCNQIPRQAAQTMLDAFQQAAPTLANLTGAARTAAARSCTQQDSAIRQSAGSLGCTI